MPKTNIRLPGLYAITPNQRRLGANYLPILEQVLAAGVSLLQFREKELSGANKCKLALQVLQLCQKYQTPMIVNDDLALAEQIDADGLHLGQQDAPCQLARQQLGPNKLIGVTCHGDLALARQAAQDGADYVAFGACFNSQSKTTAQTIELKCLAQAKRAVDLPVVAIGGIQPGNADQVLAQGADLLAVIQALFLPLPGPMDSPAVLGQAEQALASNIESFHHQLSASQIAQEGT